MFRRKPPARVSDASRRAKLAAALAIAAEDTAVAPVVGPPCSLADFVRDGWPVLEGGQPADWNWHIDAVCVHIEAVLLDWARKQVDPSYEQRTQNLLINIPPGTGKSRIVSVFCPAWVWTWWPAWRGIFLSSNPRVSLRDSVYCREVLESDWYRRKFKPEWVMSRDQNAKGLFRNSAGGFRQAQGILSKITGDRADALFIDDPHDAQDVQSSDVMRQAVLDKWDVSIANRLNDLRSSVRVGIMQRLHEDDWAGHVLRQKGWELLRLRQEFEPGDDAPTFLGWTDPRTVPGELMFPLRFPRATLDVELSRLMEYGYAGQHQQRPAPAGGGMFKCFGFVNAVDPKARRVRYWDKAGTAGGGAFTAGVKMALDKEGRYILEHVVRGQWSAGEREKIIRETAESDGRSVHVWVEQEPGSGGKESAENTIKNLAGFVVYREPVTGDKETRARPLAAQTEIGNVYLLKDKEGSEGWNEAFISEARVFPNGRYKDQVDAASGAFNKLALAPRPTQSAAAPAEPPRPVPRVSTPRTPGIPGPFGVPGSPF